MSSVAADELRLLIERIERLEEEKKGIADDIRDVYSEAKARGYDAKIMRQIIRLRKMETHERQEMEAVLETYMTALGMLAGTPLGQWARNQAEMDAKGIGVSMRVGDGPEVPLNRTAADRLNA
jgi:uncharacterized protein (UPF0335 family)